MAPLRRCISRSLRTAAATAAQSTCGGLLDGGAAAEELAVGGLVLLHCGAHCAVAGRGGAAQGLELGTHLAQALVNLAAHDVYKFERVHRAVVVDQLRNLGLQRLGDACAQPLDLLAELAAVHGHAGLLAVLHHVGHGIGLVVDVLEHCRGIGRQQGVDYLVLAVVLANLLGVDPGIGGNVDVVAVGDQRGGYLAGGFLAIEFGEPQRRGM